MIGFGNSFSSPDGSKKRGQATKIAEVSLYQRKRRQSKDENTDEISDSPVNGSALGSKAALRQNPNGPVSSSSKVVASLGDTRLGKQLLKKYGAAALGAEAQGGESDNLYTYEFIGNLNSGEFPLNANANGGGPVTACCGEAFSDASVFVVFCSRSERFVHTYCEEVREVRDA